MSRRENNINGKNVPKGKNRNNNEKVAQKRKKVKRNKKRYNKNRLFLLLGTILVVIFLFKFTINKIQDMMKGSKDSSSSHSYYQQTDEYNASILAAGDVMVHDDQLKAQYDPDTNTYSFDNNFKYVKKYVENADYAIANLETTLSRNDVTPYSSYPQFNSPDELADGLKYAGFDLISTINNHTFDKGDLGFKRTLETLKNKGFDTVGTGENVGDGEYIIKNINNINVGITSYSYGDIINGTKYLNGIKVSEESKDKMNVFPSNDVDKAFEIINSTVEKISDTDLQIVVLHWGTEYERNTIDFQKQLAQKLSDAGVDIIIGSHPHVVEPVETITSTNGDNETVVIYSLGNFLSNQSRETVGQYSEDGLMVNIDISKNKNEKDAKVKKVTCIPTWVHRYKVNEKLTYEIIPIENMNDLNKVKSLDKANIKSSYNNTNSMIGKTDIITVVDSPFK